VLVAPFREKQRLEDGAFIAALLVDDDPHHLRSEAEGLFRGVLFANMNAQLFKSSKGGPEDYALSHPCKLNSIDFFVSHSKSKSKSSPSCAQEPVGHDDHDAIDIDMTSIVGCGRLVRRRGPKICLPGSHGRRVPAQTWARGYLLAVSCCFCHRFVVRMRFVRFL
jgi:hypothetical protein